MTSTKNNQLYNSSFNPTYPQKWTIDLFFKKNIIYKRMTNIKLSSPLLHVNVLNAWSLKTLIEFLNYQFYTDHEKEGATQKFLTALADSRNSSCTWLFRKLEHKNLQKCFYVEAMQIQNSSLKWRVLHIVKNKE